MNTVPERLGRWPADIWGEYEYGEGCDCVFCAMGADTGCSVKADEDAVGENVPDCAECANDGDTGEPYDWPCACCVKVVETAEGGGTADDDDWAALPPALESLDGSSMSVGHCASPIGGEGWRPLLTPGEIELSLVEEADEVARLRLPAPPGSPERGGQSRGLSLPVGPLPSAGRFAGGIFKRALRNGAGGETVGSA